MRSLIVWILVVLFIITGIVFIFYYKHQQSTLPILEIKKAREVLSIAQKKGAVEYPNEFYVQANNAYDSAMASWNFENKKILILRDFSKTKEFAKTTVELAFKSIEAAKNSTQYARERLALQIMNIKDQLKSYNSLYGRIPLNEFQRSQLNNGKLNLNEGVIAFKNEDFDNASKKLNIADELLNPVLFYAKSEFDNYFKNETLWQSLIDQSIALSRKSKTSLIIVDKYARECFLFESGKKKESFKIELSKNWIGNKNCQGDYSTPEGFYKIIAKKKQPQTKYYKALLLNYPNEEDKKRFIQNKKHGVLDPKKDIGNLIEIHGEGGKGVDWTQGCIAVENTEMDNLFAICQVGTQVTIVGSTKTKNELLKID